MTTNATTMLRKRDRTPEDFEVNTLETLLRSLTRYPIQSLTLLRGTVQVSANAEYLTGKINEYRELPDPEAAGRPYLSVVPFIIGSGDRTERFYLTRYEKLLTPFFDQGQRRMIPYVDEQRKLDQQRIILKLERFPILSPTLLQSALGPSSKMWRWDMKRLIEKRYVDIWHQNMLETGPGMLDGKEVPNIGAWTRSHITKEDVTYRGVRYFLHEHAERLEPFLVRD